MGIGCWPAGQFRSPAGWVIPSRGLSVPLPGHLVRLQFNHARLLSLPAGTGTYLHRRCRAISAERVEQAQGLPRDNYPLLVVAAHFLEQEEQRDRSLGSIIAASPTFTIMKVSMTLVGMGQNAPRVQSSSVMPLSASKAVHRGKGVRDRRIFRSDARRDATSAGCADSPNTCLSISRSQPRCFNAAGFQIKCLSSMPGWHSMRLKKQIMAKECQSPTSARFGRFLETGGIFFVLVTR